MDTLPENQHENRETYVNKWYRTEKSIYRITGVALFFMAALVAVFDKPGDQWTLFTITVSIAGGMTLLIRNRRPRSVRTDLHFLTAKTQNSRATMAGIGAVILISMMGTRPLALIVGIALGAVAFWYQWRAYKIRHLDELVTKSRAESSGENDL